MRELAPGPHSSTAERRMQVIEQGPSEVDMIAEKMIVRGGPHNRIKYKKYASIIHNRSHHLVTSRQLVRHFFAAEPP